MTIVVSMSVDPSMVSGYTAGPSDADQDRVPDNLARVTAAYARVYAQFESALARSIDVANLDDPQIRRSSVPELVVSFDEGESTTIVFDADLLSSLIELYALRGWRGVAAVERTLGGRWATETDGTPTSGGTGVSVWAAVAPFFKATRNLLASLVRDALVEIEREARSRIEQQLKAIDEALERAWTAELRMLEVEKLTYERQPDKERSPVVTRSFAFGNRALADDLFTDMTFAVKAKTEVEDKLKRATRDAAQLAARQDAEQRNRQNAGAPGMTSPYAEDATPENVERKKAEAADAETQFQSLVASLQAGLAHNVPLALLVFDGLQPGFRQADMEHRIGAALATLRQRVRTLRATLEKSGEQVALRFADDPAKALGDFGPASSAGVENALLDDVLQRPDEVAFVPLLSQDTWHELVSSDAIPKGGFSYFVYFHYMNGLLTRQADAAAKEGRVANVMGMSLAIVSIAVAFFPVFAAAEVALGVFALCHALHDAASRLSQVDTALAGLLVQPGSSVMPAMARIGELERLRSEMILTVPAGILLGLVANMTGQRWLLTKRLLLGYGYFSDLKTLYEGLHGTSEAQD